MKIRTNPRSYGTARVAPEKDDNLRYAGEPISDYWQAVLSLVQHFEKMGEYYDTGPLPFAADIVGRMFWVSPSLLRADLIRLRKAMVR